MTRNKIRYSSYMGIAISVIEILEVTFLLLITLAYGLFLKGTPAGGDNVLIGLQVTLSGRILLLYIALIILPIILVFWSKAIKEYDTLSAVDYKKKTPTIISYIVVNIIYLLILTTINILLIIPSAFEGAMILVPILSLGICLGLIIPITVLLLTEHIKNNKVVKEESQVILNQSATNNSASNTLNNK